MSRSLAEHSPIVVDPRFDPAYASFYLEGIRARFGRMSFSQGPFPERLARDDAFRFVLGAGPGALRLAVSPNDWPHIDEPTAEWCDAYGVVNLDRTVVDGRFAHKVLAIGPGFGLRVWTPTATARVAVTTWRATRPRPPVVAHLRRYVDLARTRQPLERYRPATGRDDYLFFTGWTWKKHEEVNPPRGRFVEAARGVDGLTFEGGLAPRRRSDLPGYDDVSAPKRYPLAEYLEKVGRSVAAFNTPAVHDCLGWKLGEFLALGKAIITLPLTRELPAPLVHGADVHVVDDDVESMRDAIVRLRVDEPYRRRLEAAARAYWERWLAPGVVVDRLVAAAGG